MRCHCCFFIGCHFCQMFIWTGDVYFNYKRNENEKKASHLTTQIYWRTKCGVSIPNNIFYRLKPNMSQKCNKFRIPGWQIWVSILFVNAAYMILCPLSALYMTICPPYVLYMIIWPPPVLYMIISTLYVLYMIICTLYVLYMIIWPPSVLCAIICPCFCNTHS